MILGNGSVSVVDVSEEPLRSDYCGVQALEDGNGYILAGHRRVPLCVDASHGRSRRVVNEDVELCRRVVNVGEPREVGIGLKRRRYAPVLILASGGRSHYRIRVTHIERIESQVLPPGDRVLDVVSCII